MNGVSTALIPYTKPMTPREFVDIEGKRWLSKNLLGSIPICLKFTAIDSPLSSPWTDESISLVRTYRHGLDILKGYSFYSVGEENNSPTIRILLLNRTSQSIPLSQENIQ